MWSRERAIEGGHRVAPATAPHRIGDRLAMFEARDGAGGNDVALTGHFVPAHTSLREEIQLCDGPQHRQRGLVASSYEHARIASASHAARCAKKRQYSPIGYLAGDAPQLAGPHAGAA